MQTRMLSKLEVSVVGLGCNNFGKRVDAGGTKAVVDSALDSGVTLFDTADMYSEGESERFLGAALRGRRDEAVIATKYGAQMGDDPARSGARPEYVRQACEDSLRRLGVDHIDLYQQHRPDDDVPIEDTLAALNDLVDEGKVIEIGCSNFSAGQLDWAQRTASDDRTAAFVSVQNHYSLLHREPESDGVLQTCDQHDLGFLPYFPLASGMLTGKYTRDEPPPEGTRLAGLPAERSRRYLNERNFTIVEQLRTFAEERDHELVELAIAWLAAQPVVASVIAGATTPDQVRTNAAAARWHLSDDEVAEISRVAAPQD
ncbi:MAG: aldo/keto reductase [Egibacteraceae bacterium]